MQTEDSLMPPMFIPVAHPRSAASAAQVGWWAPRAREPQADVPGRPVYRLEVLSSKRNTMAGGELGVFSQKCQGIQYEVCSCEGGYAWMADCPRSTGGTKYFPQWRFPESIDKYSVLCGAKLRQAWDLGPGTLAAVLQCLHLDTAHLEQQNAKKLYGTETNCVHVQVGQILDKRSKETKKPNWHFWRAWSKSRVLCMPCCTQYHLRGGHTT